MGNKVIAGDFLFARPTTWSGMARVLDLGGTFDAYNGSTDGDEADAKAMFADWAAVGQDIADAADVLKPEDDSADKAA